MGAPSEDSNARGVNGDGGNNAAPDSGAAYVFVRNAGVWKQQAYIKASNADTGDLFGTAVAIWGDTVMVGAPREASNARGVNGDQGNNQGNNTADRSGAAYVFVRNAGVWTQQAYLKASNADLLDLFGTAVAMSGDTVVVGAPGESSNVRGVNGDQGNHQGNTDAFSTGAAYVFVRNAGVWTQQAYLKDSISGQSKEVYFGFAAAVSGDTVVVVSLTGSYAFNRNRGVWTSQGKVVGGAESASISDGSVVLGTPFFDFVTVLRDTCRVVTIPATAEFVSAGDFEANTRLSLFATGAVSISSADFYVTEANGIITQGPRPGSDIFNYFSGEPPSGPPVPGALKLFQGYPLGSLVGTFGAAGATRPDPARPIFVVGTRFASSELQVPNLGLGGARLFLTVVDGGKTDNSGEFKLEIGQGSCSPTRRPTLSVADPPIVTVSAGASDQSVRISAALGETAEVIPFVVQLPAETWLTIDNTTGVTAGFVAYRLNPAGLAPGDYQSTVTVRSPESPVPAAFTVRMRVTAATPLSISCTTQPNASYRAGQDLSIGCSATGGAEPFTWTASGLPSGVTLRGSPGRNITLAGTLTTAGTYTITLNVASGAQSATYTNRLEILPAVIGNSCPAVTIAGTADFAAAGDFAANARFALLATGEVSTSSADTYYTEANGVITRGPTSGSGIFNYFNGEPPVGPPLAGVAKIYRNSPYGDFPYGSLVGTFAARGATRPDSSQPWFLVGTRFASTELAIPNVGNSGAARLFLTVVDGGKTDNSGEFKLEVVQGGCSPISRPTLSVTDPSLLTVASGGVATDVQSIRISAVSGQSAASIRFVLERPAESWLTVNTAAGTTSGLATYKVNPAGLAPGDYQSTVTVRSPESPLPAAFTVRMRVSGVAPRISEVGHGTTYWAGGLVPGSWAQIKGTNLAAATRIWADRDFIGLGNRLPTNLDGVQVRVNGQLAAIYFISPTQVNFQVPDGARGDVPVQLTNNGELSNILQTQALESAPGIFPVLVSGVVYPAAVLLDGKLVGDPGVAPAFRRARPGELVQLYATGLRSVPAGVRASRLDLTGVTVRIGQSAVPADYAGLVQVGQFQINFRTPNLPPGRYVISLLVNGESSPTTINATPNELIFEIE